MRKGEIHKKAEELFECSDSHVAMALSLLVLAITHEEGHDHEGAEYAVADIPMNTGSAHWKDLVGSPVCKTGEAPDGLWMVRIRARDGKWWPHDAVRRERFVKA